MVHLIGLFNLFFPERSWFVGVGKGGCCEKILDAGDTLIGVDRKKGREVPSIGEVGVCGESITCDFPDSDSVSKNSFVGMFGCFPVVNGGCGKLVVMNVAILMFRCILGLSDSGQVWGEDNALWIAEDSGVCHFLVACGSSVGGVSRLGPYDFFSLVSHTGWQEDVGVVKFPFCDRGEVVGVCHSCLSTSLFLRCRSLALVRFVI